eukprot:jgi/Chrzof1/8434/Cz03g10160.t1
MSQQVARPTRDMDGSTSEIPDGMVDKVKYYVNKLRNADNETWGKDEVLDVLYWWRQLVGLFFGLVWGIAPLTGWYAFAGFIVLNMVITVSIYKNIMGVDEEDFGGHNELLGEGVQGSSSVFMVTWILTYTALHS